MPVKPGLDCLGARVADTPPSLSSRSRFRVHEHLTAPAKQPRQRTSCGHAEVLTGSRRQHHPAENSTNQCLQKRRSRWSVNRMPRGRREMQWPPPLCQSLRLNFRFSNILNPGIPGRYLVFFQFVATTQAEQHDLVSCEAFEN